MNARPRRFPGAPFWIPGVLVAGVALSLALHLHLRHREERDTAEAAAEVTRQHLEHLHVSILRSMEVLHSVAALHAAHGGLDRPLFRAFVQSALARQPELQALSWNPRVPHADRPRLEAGAVADGLPGFTFLETAPGGGLQTAADRAEYVPVFLIEPQAQNHAALGFDLGSDPSRRATLDQARDSGLPVATAPIRLAQGPVNTAGILVVLPVFVPPSASAANPDHPRGTLAGFAVAVFRIPDLVGATFRELQKLGIDAVLVDEAPGGERLFAPSPEPVLPTATAATASLEVAGRRWSVVFHPNRAFAGHRTPRSSPWVLALGLLFTLSTCAHLVHAGRRTLEIARANAALREEVVTRQRAEAAAAAANKAKSDFLTRMSHEIRTPLNAILGHAQLMQRDLRLPAESREAAHGIQAGGRHLLGLLNEVLDLAKIEAGRMELHPVDFNLADLATGIAATFRPLCFQKRLALHLHLPDAPSHAVHGDEGKLRQILLNLVGNAIKFTRAGEVQLHVRPRNPPPHHWLFEVLDTGLGIPESEQPDIFKPFHQGSGAGHQGGTGLGLAIAQRQVELLGGTLAFESERGVGSRFHFTIPLPPAHAPETTVHSPNSPTEPATDSAAPSPVPNPAPPDPPPGPGAEAHAAPASVPVPLPAALFHRLTLAAELHSSTALKACLPELHQLGPDASRLADELRWLLRSFDMQAIQRALGRIQIQPESSAPPAADADPGGPRPAAEPALGPGRHPTPP